MIPYFCHDVVWATSKMCFVDWWLLADTIRVSTSYLRMIDRCSFTILGASWGRLRHCARTDVPRRSSNTLHSCRFPPSSFGFVSHGESWAGPQGKVIECFHRCILPAYILRWHESNDFTGCVTLVLDLGNRNPLCLENFTNASSSKEENKQQCLVIFCLRKWVFSGMAIDHVSWDTWLFGADVLRNHFWLQVERSQIANETTLSPVLHF